VGVVPSRDGRTLYVALGRAHAVAFVDLARRAVTTRVPVGERPWGVALSPDGTRLFTADGRAGAVSVLDPRRHKVVARVPVGERPYGVLYVARRR
jgi:YVTN family beta-propeller protein